MPGRNPNEAVDNFTKPLADAINVLSDFSTILLSKRGGYRKGEEYTWVLCGPGGMALTGVGTFHAEMRFEVIDADPVKYGAAFRVSTRGYRYKLRATGETEDEWLIHWHPKGDSPYKDPHVHIKNDLTRHLPTGRITFEKVIAWCIEYGAPIRGSKDDAINALALIEAPHLLHRSWSDSPQGEARP